jgi:hypothetical protein
VAVVYLEEADVVKLFLFYRDFIPSTSFADTRPRICGMIRLMGRKNSGQ